MVMDLKVETDRQIEEKRRLREEAEILNRREEEKALTQNQYDDEAKLMIAQERERLIKECAAQVFEYMNKGQLTDNDLTLLPAELQ